ncbi:Wings apart-like protein-like protein [Nymphaea thermarum]|nr:Wings apart-like protein-like protein [Nymphaea thermarum]
MIVRTYARRNRGPGGTGLTESGTEDDVLWDSLSQESSQEIFGLPFSSSQDSSSWSLDESARLCIQPSSKEPEEARAIIGRAPKRPREEVNAKNRSGQILGKVPRRAPSAPATSTLMEAQEFGEMMEHVDEANFALDGLKPGRPFRIQRASLLSLLSVCSTPQQRRLLRTHGMAKEIFDAILGLSTDDSPSSLAAAVLFYALACDGQDEHLLESSAYVRFLLKFLNPCTSADIERKPIIGSNLLAVNGDIGLLTKNSKSVDSTTMAIMLKVQELLLSCKELHMGNCDEDVTRRPQLNSKWVALLALEKACLSTISLEDTSGSVRRVGGNFKEKLRELGGLDVVFGVAVDCYSVLEAILKESMSPLHELKSGDSLQSLALLAKCLKIMENSTFLSKDNQSHLLEINSKFGCDGSTLSFIGLVINIIRVLSGICLSDNSPQSFAEPASSHDLDGLDNSHSQGSEVKSQGLKETGCCSTKVSNIPCEGNNLTCNCWEMSDSYSDLSGAKFDSAASGDNVSVVKNSNCQSSFVCRKRESISSSKLSCKSVNCSKKNSSDSDKLHNLANDTKAETDDKNHDPFAFDEDDIEPTKWEALLSTKKKPSQTAHSKMSKCNMNNGEETELTRDNHEACEGNSISLPNADSSTTDETADLLGECLLTAVKVLMNLTNDNPIGCQQTGECGGLDTMAHLIVGHFPRFHLQPPASQNNNYHHQNIKHLSDQELDFLVAILGLLVNLVEKDNTNRARLAAASVSLPSLRKPDGKNNCVAVIPLLCSIFLANQGSGEAIKDAVPLNDETSVLQGQREAEKMIVEAYSALLLAFLSIESSSAREAIACHLPENNLRILVPVLERFVAFHLSLNMISPETHSAVSEVIECCRCP